MAYIEDRWSKDPARQGKGARWRVRYRDPQRHWRSEAFTRRSEAERFLHKLANDLNDGTYANPDRGRITVAQVAETWFRSHAPTLKVSTATSYRGVLDLLVLPRWKQVTIAEVTFADTAAWMGDLISAGVSAQRARHAYGILAQMLDYAVADRRLIANPIRGMKLPPLPIRQRHRYLTHSELLQVAMASGNARPLIMVLGYTGLRWSEAVGLRTRDVDFDRGRFQIDRSMVEVAGKLHVTTPKTHERRSVPVPSLVMDTLNPLGPEDLLFTTELGQPHLGSNFRRKAWMPALERAEVEPLRIHDLRHTAASLAVSAGASVLAIARMLGHADPSVTLRVYADLFDTDLDQVAIRLDAAARETVIKM